MPARTATTPYMMPAQVADLFQVSPKTVNRWAHEGKLPFTRTLGGHRRFPSDQIRALRLSLEVKALENGGGGGG